MSFSEVERLENALDGDSGAAVFPSLAEAHRRGGRPDEAERVARAGLERRPDALAGRVALGLALLDLERLDEARAELERVLTSVPDHPLALAGLESSEAVAAPTPNPYAESAFAAGLDGDEGETAFGDRLDGGEIDAAFAEARPEEDQMISTDNVAASAIRTAELDELEDFGADAQGIPVANYTVAGLLEGQGHADDAQTMRASLHQHDRERVIATLEGWLDNLRRTAA